MATAGSDSGWPAGPAGHAPLTRGPRPDLATEAGEQHQDEHRGTGPDSDGLTNLQQSAGNAAVASMLTPGPGDLVRSVVGSAGHPMDSSTRDFVRAATGQDPSGIQVHEGPDAARAADSVGAEMFASGHHLVAPDGLDVTTERGAFKTVHEVHHIVSQQAKGPVEGTETEDGLKISDPSDRHEREADGAAAEAVAKRFGS